MTGRGVVHPKYPSIQLSKSRTYPSIILSSSHANNKLSIPPKPPPTHLSATKPLLIPFKPQSLSQLPPSKKIPKSTSISNFRTQAKIKLNSMCVRTCVEAGSLSLLWGPHFCGETQSGSGKQQPSPKCRKNYKTRGTVLPPHRLGRRDSARVWDFGSLFWC